MTSQVVGRSYWGRISRSARLRVLALVISCQINNSSCVCIQFAQHLGESWKCVSESNSTETVGTIPRRWLGMSKSKLTKEASTSMEDITYLPEVEVPGTVRRPKSMCVPDSSYLASENIYVELPSDYNRFKEKGSGLPKIPKNCSCDVPCDSSCSRGVRNYVRRNPVQRAASRLYSAGREVS
ncbi:hypothetical protein HHI36_012998 [Cryptolaemus montrouzieri]|uniref:Uncharacterized protein n=1 Tax=Cryptolaemus montrouzieri TaxID=559131 RepID=A0ABD2NGX0_9CUCU